MTLSKTLFVAAAVLAAPMSTAFAQEATEGEEGGAEGGDEGAPASDSSTGDPVASVGATAPGERPSSIIDRSLTLGAGKLAVQADLGIARISILGNSATSIGMLLGAGYGVNEKLTVGGLYGFTIDEFEIKGPLTAYASYNLTDDGKLAVAAGANLTLDLAADNAFAIDAGLAVRYKVAPKFALFTGNPYTPGPAGQHLHLGLSGDESKTFSIPVGAAFQATPQLYAFLQTNLATISLSDPGMGDRVSSFNNSIPLGIGAWFNVNKNLDVGASYTDDLKFFGDLFIILAGARYYN